MDERVARERLTAERAEVAQLLKDAESAGESDREVEATRPATTPIPPSR